MAFVGRERELAQLAEAVRRVAEGRLGRVVVTGPAGIGCTRLLDELGRRVSSVPGVRACRGRAYEPAAGIPYQAVGDALAQGLAALSDGKVTEVVANAGHDLSILVPGLSDRLDELGVDRSAPALVAPDQVGRRVLESILGVLERLAGDGVLLLSLEDVHFADPATRGLIEAMQGVGRSLPVCLVVSYQSDELHRRHPIRGLADRLAEDPDVVRLDLEPLSQQDLKRLVTDVAGTRPPANVMTAVAQGARGNPLIALQLAQSAETLEGVRLSDTFEQLCGARMEALSGEGARVVRVMAGARVPLKEATLLAVQPPDGRITVKGIEEALHSRFVVETGDELAMSHELFAEAIEALELTPERLAIHAALAARLHEAPALAAWHWSRAGWPNEARDAHIRAATAALRLDPGETVREHYEEALELPGAADISPEERSKLLAGAAAASAAAGTFRRAVAFQRRAIDARATRDRTPGRGQRDAATRLALGEMNAELGQYQYAGGDPAGALSSIERALGIMPTGPSRIRAHAQALLAQHLMFAGRFEESASVAEEARATAEAARAGDEETLAELSHATCTLGIDVAYLGDLETGLTLLEQASDLARRAGRLDHLMRAAANRTTLLCLDSRRAEALAVVVPSLEQAAAGGLAASYGAKLRGNAADILFDLGRWHDAEQECRIALEWQMGALEASWWPPLVLGLVLTESRADEEARRLVGQALLSLETVPAGQWTDLVLRSAISLALWSGDADAALAIGEREWPRALGTGELAIVATAAAACLEAAAAAADQGRAGGITGLIARARALAEQVLPQAEAHVAGSPLGPDLGARQEADLLLATAQAHAARVKGGVVPDVWDGLARAWLEKSMPYPAAKARWWQALAILDGAPDDDRGSAKMRAREPLAEALRIASELPALPLLKAVVDLAARARVPLPDAQSSVSVEEARELVAVGPGDPSRPVAVGPGLPGEARPQVAPHIARAIDERVLASLRSGPADTYGLSPREREVLNILSEGRTDRDIAARLFISERTVHVHVRRILSKLGVSSRTEAAGLAIRQGLVPMQPSEPASGQSAPDDVASRA